MERHLRGRVVSSGQAMEITIRGNTIVGLQPIESAADLPWIAPGFLDHQVNGFKGYDLNSANTTSESVMGLTRALWSTGVTRYAPTIITNTEERLVDSIKAVIAACKADPRVDAAIPAIHIEGPFISPLDGPRGAHHPACVRPPDWNEFLRWQEAAEGRIGIVTLSPEWPEAPAFIERLVDSGVVAAIGHTAATPDQIHEAVRAGAGLSTHLGNGAHLMLPRHPNYIWEQLACDELWAGVILDGFHLPPSVAKVFFRAKGIERILLTTDAVAMAGLPPGRYRLGEVDVEMAANGRIEVVGGGGVLAGSALTMPEAIANAMRFGDVTLAQAVAMATTQPARVLGIGCEEVAVGSRADLVLFDYTPEADGAGLRIRATYLQGELVYTAEE